MRSKPPVRPFVIMARDAPVAAVIKRGPSDWYQVLRWDTTDDTITEGAWFRGRIYPEKCDLSPDGELIVVFCHQGRKVGTSYTDAWTAVSRLPWLHALALWPQGTTYGGGGRFLDDRRLAIRSHAEAHPDHPPDGLVVVTGASPPLRASEELVDDAQWSGRDQSGAVVLCRGGKLLRVEGGSEVEVADLNGAEPKPVAAPGWARAPLS